MHICFIALDYPSQLSGGGVGNQVRLLGRKLVSRGHHVSVVALQQKNLPEYTHDQGIEVYRTRRGNAHWYIQKLPGVGKHLGLPCRELEYAWACFNQVKRIHKLRPIDVIETTETGAFLTALLMRRVGQVVRLHGETYTFHKYTPDLLLTPAVRLSRALQRIALWRADQLISPSVAHADEIRAELKSWNLPITVIPNSLDMNPTTTSGAPVARQATSSGIRGGVAGRPSSTLSRPNSSTVSARVAYYAEADGCRHNQVDRPLVAQNTILFVARLERRKGLLPLLEAMVTVSRSFPSAHLLLAGSPHPSLSLDELNATIARLNLGERVQVQGHVPWEPLQQLYCEASVFVMPSYYETFGVAALEAMSHGLPVIGTTGGALPEVIEHGVTGLLVPPGDSAALGQAIIALLADPGLRQQMGAAGKQRVQRLFMADTLLEQSLSVYEGAIAQASGHAYLFRHN